MAVIDEVCWLVGVLFPYNISEACIQSRTNFGSSNFFKSERFSAKDFLYYMKSADEF